MSRYVFLYVYVYVCVSISLESSKVVIGEGMPTHKNPFRKGDIIINFHVQFPEDGFAGEQQLTVSLQYNDITLLLKIRKYGHCILYQY